MRTDECCGRGAVDARVRGVSPLGGESGARMQSLDSPSVCSLVPHPGCLSTRGRMVGRDSHLSRKPRHVGSGLSPSGPSTPGES